MRGHAGALSRCRFSGDIHAFSSRAVRSCRRPWRGLLRPGPGTSACAPARSGRPALSGGHAAQDHAEREGLRQLPLQREPVVRRRPRSLRVGERRHGAGPRAQRRLRVARESRRLGAHAQVDWREPQRPYAQPSARQRHCQRHALRGGHRHRALVRHEDRRAQGQREGRGRHPLQRPGSGRRRHHLRHPDRHAARPRPPGASTR